MKNGYSNCISVLSDSDELSSIHKNSSINIISIHAVIKEFIVRLNKSIRLHVVIVIVICLLKTNGMDNRKVNLRLITQTQQNYNTKRRARVTVLPDNCGISTDDIPRNIYYMKPNGHHGDRFVVELKGLPDGDIEWKSTSSKSISLQEKLNQAKTKLHELYLLHNLHQEDENVLKKKLAEEYNKILEMAIISHES